MVYVGLWSDSRVTGQLHKMAAVSPLPPSSSKAAVRGKQRRTVSESLDPLYYNQLLDELRQQQDAGSAYFGNFVYEPRGVPASLLLPSGTPIFQPNTPLPFSQSGPALVGNHALVFERVASAEVEKDSAAVRFLMEPPATVRPGTLATNPSSAGKRTGTPFKSPAVTGEPADLKPAVDAVKFIEKAKAHYSSKCAASGFRCVRPIPPVFMNAAEVPVRFDGHNVKPGVSIVSFWTFVCGSKLTTNE